MGCLRGQAIEQLVRVLLIRVDVEELASKIKQSDASKHFTDKLHRWRVPIAVVVACIVLASLASKLLNVDTYEKDPYEVLGIERGASLGAIRKAYRKLSLQYHPEKPGYEEHEAYRAFANIQKAYEALTDCIFRPVSGCLGKCSLNPEHDCFRVSSSHTASGKRCRITADFVPRCWEASKQVS